MKILNPFEGEVWIPKNFLSLSADDGGDDGGDNSGGGGEEGGEADDGPQRPDFVPEKFWDPDSGEVRLQAAFESYGNLERKIGQKEEQIRESVAQELEEQRLANRPENPSNYEFALPSDYTEMGIDIDDNDPLISFWREAAHDLGLSNDDANDMLRRYVDHAIKQQPDPDAELKKLGDTGKVRARALGQWAERNFRDEELQAIHSMTTTAAGVTALERLVQMAQGDQGPPRDFGDTQVQTQVDEDQLKAMMDDPRYWDPMKRDPSYVKKVDNGFAKLYGVKRQ